MSDVGQTNGAVSRRRAALTALGGETFDLLVVGGGINGVAIARDAALRGLRTALVERGDLSSGTSSQSSKLIHGGLRYLAEGHVGLVLEAVRERERLRTLAPHLIRPQEFLFPVYEGGPVSRWKLKAGLLAYDVLAGLWNVRRHRMLGARAVQAAEPALRREGLRAAGQYWDYRTDDARLVLETGLAAAREGATIVTYAEVLDFLVEHERLAGARVVDRVGGETIEVRARVVVNATGPWVDTVARLDGPTPTRLRLTKGVHVVVRRDRIGHRAAIVLHAVRDGRVMFCIPWEDHSLIGTTDTDHAGGPEARPVVERDDVLYLLETVNHYFPEARLGLADVVSAFAGLRPLVAPSDPDAPPSAVSREEEIFTSPRGLLSIAGGKLTTHRLVASSMVDRVIDALRRAGIERRFTDCRTDRIPLPGGRSDPMRLATAAISADGHGLSPQVVHHLADRYGSRLDEVLAIVAADAELGGQLASGLPEPRAEVVAAVEQEWALTVEDVLRRRTQVALRDPEAGAAALPDVVEIMARHLGWNPETARAAIASYLAATRESRARWR